MIIISLIVLSNLGYESGCTCVPNRLVKKLKCTAMVKHNNTLKYGIIIYILFGSGGPV